MRWLLPGVGLAGLVFSIASCGGDGSSSKASAASNPTVAVAAATTTASKVQPCQLLTSADLTPLLGGQVQNGNPLTPDICGIVTSGGAIAGGGVLVTNLGAPAAPGDKIGDPQVGGDGSASIHVVKGSFDVKVQFGAGGAATAEQKSEWLKQIAATVNSRLP